MKKVLVIAGVTGAGKSAFSIECAKALNGEIISADSVAIYKHLDIGSAKLSLEDQDGVIHHLMDDLKLDEPFDVATFQRLGRKLIDDITARGKLPIVVGGTGLYINALIQDYRFDEPVHVVDERLFDDLSNEALVAELERVDPQVLNSIHPNNRQRLIRALARYHETKRPQHEITNHTKDVRLYDAMVLFFTGDREVMYERMNHRVNVMFEMGLENEVRELSQRDSKFFDYSATQAIGYREFVGYFDGTYDFDTLVALIQRNTRRFAKRQWTWFKHQTEAKWVDISYMDKEGLLDEIAKWMAV